MYCRDIQSWDGGYELDLSPSRLNVVKAMSETGKSSISRFLSAFCQNPDTRHDYSDIIRKGKESAYMILSYDDGHVLALSVNQYERTLGFLNNNNPEENVIYYHDDINEDVLTKYGLIYDSKNQMLFNVYSRDIPLFLIQTPSTLNGAIWSRVSIDREVESVLDYLKDRELYLRDNYKYHCRTRDNAIDACKNLKTYDVDKLKSIKYDIENLLSCMTDIEDFVSKYENNLYTIKNNEGIKKPSVTGKYVDELYNLLNSIKCLEDNIQILKNTSAVKRPCRYNYLEDLLVCVSFENQLRQVCDKTKECQQKEIKVSQVDNLQLLAVAVENVSKISKCLYSARMNKESAEQIDKSLYHYNLQLEEIKAELKVCPLCGGSLIDERCNHNN